VFWQTNPKERLGYVILVALVLAIIGVLGYRANIKPSEASQVGFTTRTSKSAMPLTNEVVVHVVGAVNNPGVYHFTSSARTQDAVKAAGGPTAKADLENVNLAAKLNDGQQIRVPEKGEGSSSNVPIGGGKSGKLASGKISLNNAGLDQLCLVPGIGPATAQKIITYRQAHGGFTSIEQLQEVGGIGPKKFERMQPFLQL